MIKQKQVQGLEELNSQSFVKAFLSDNNTVTLLKSDGFSLSFSTDDIAVGTKGDKGDVGNKGSNGLSAYELAVINGYQGTESDWRQELQGKKGSKGFAGRNGVNGKNGHMITLAEDVTVLQGDELSFVFDNDGSATFTFPDIRQGQQGPQGERYRIRKCLLVEGDQFNVSTSWNNYAGSLNVTLPAAQQGVKGDKGITVNGKSPTLTSVKINNNLPAGSSWHCFSNGLESRVFYDFELSAAPQGEKGVKGKDGLPGAVTNSLTVVEETVMPPEGYVAFISKDTGAFSFFNFRNKKHSTIGFGLYENNVTFVSADKWKEGTNDEG